MPTWASDMRVERCAGALGAAVTGIDLSDGCDAALAGRLRAALLEHLVICIRGQQRMTPETQLRFASQWGEILVHPYIRPIEGYPGILLVDDPNAKTSTWHSDTTYIAAPPAITMLRAVTLPAIGGDTMFANQYAAYEQLSPGLRKVLRSMRAVHYGTEERVRQAGIEAQLVIHAHPVVRAHPETERASLFVNSGYTRHFEDWSEAESAPLLAHLYASAVRPELTYRHRWQVGDLLIWDNRCTMHAVIGDTVGGGRLLHRVTIAGDAPR